MSQNRTSIPKGMRDFSPGQVRKRQYIIQIMKEVFELFSFEPIETPSMEKPLHTHRQIRRRGRQAPVQGIEFR